MRGLEVVVRPVVFPDIRPAPARSLPPQDDPDKGFAVIHGQAGKQVDLTWSYSSSASSNKRQETKRRVDEVRVYQKRKDGTINKNNFVDIQVTNKMWNKGPPKQPEGPGFYVPEGNRTYRGTGNETEIVWFSPIEATDNTEIIKKNKMIQSRE